MRMTVARGPDAGTLFLRALRAQASVEGLRIAIRSIATRPWASATFVGTRHGLVVDAQTDTGLDRWIAALPEVEWAIRGHLVADLVVDAVTITDDGATILIAVLTIEDN